MSTHSFIKYESIYDPDLFFYGLEKDGMTKTIDGVEFFEVTTDFSNIQWVRSDSLRGVGKTNKTLYG